MNAHMENAMRITVAIALLLAAACAPARAAAPDVKPIPTAQPAASPAETPAAVGTPAPTPAAVVTPGATSAESRAPISAKKDRLRWIEGPPSMKGSRMSTLEGNWKQAGMFTVRVSVNAGSQVPLHTHPNDERVTVLEGKVKVVLGDDPSKPGETYGPGDFYLTPAGMPHSVTFEEKSLLQITGMGPWEVVPYSKP